MILGPAGSPLTGTTTSSYDAHGNLTQQTDARNITSARTFDDLDRVLQRSRSDGTATVTFTYDGPASQFRLGRLAAITEGTSPVSYSYDAFGRLTQDGTLTYAYDANGNRKTIGYGGGLFACYSFDDADRQSNSLARKRHELHLWRAEHYHRLELPRLRPARDPDSRQRRGEFHPGEIRRFFGEMP